MTVTRPEVPLTVITPDDVRTSIRRAKKSLVDAANEVVWQIEMEAWRTLGYSSWTAMREAEYGGVAFMVPSKDRPELVARIRAKGITQREAAATTGVTEQTIYNDERKARDPKYLGRHQDDGDVIDAEVIEDDEPQVDTKAGEVSDDYVTDQADLDAAPELPDEGAPMPRDSGDAEPSEDEGLSVPSPSSRSVTGLDGKQYARPEPKPAENKERPGSAMSATEAEQDRQVQEARDLSRALLTLAAFQYQQARNRYRESWNAQPYARGNGEQFYNPTTIRLIAKSLTTFATELEEA